MQDIAKQCAMKSHFENDELVLETNNLDGRGEMRFYEVMDGIVLVFNEYKMNNIKSEFKTNDNLFCIDYCLDGRLEQANPNNTFSYFKAGDCKLDNLNNHDVDFFFPLGYFKGITVGFDVEKAQVSIDKCFPDFPFKLMDIKNKYCASDDIFFIRANQEIDRIFSYLSNPPKAIKTSLIKIKILELLLYVATLNIEETSTHPLYFSKNITHKVKNLHEYLLTNIDNHDTLDDLAAMFEISLTNMKLCFKEIYGQPIHRYLRRLRMHKACDLLANTNEEIVNIASFVGYDNPSKFAAAFKKEIGILPNAYRRNKKEN